MKRVIVLLSVLTIAVSLSGCGEDEDQTVDLVIDMPASSSEIDMPGESDVINLEDH